MQNMKIVQIIGGLGNQLFQYAFGIALHHETGDQILFDKTWFDKTHTTPRAYHLDKYNTNISLATKHQISWMQKPLYLRITNPIRAFFHIKKQKRVRHEKHNIVYCPELFTFRGNQYYNGYYQCENYFKKYRDEILNNFKLIVPLDAKNIEMLKHIKNTNSVSLHVRRGDYVRLADSFGLCSLDYYKNAIKHIATHVKNPHFFLFSDDLDWVLKNLKIDFPFTAVDINHGDTEYFDLELMRNCQHNIIANSTFAWWGAWLNTNPNKIVIAPDPWLLSIPHSDIVPPEWVKIKM